MLKTSGYYAVSGHNGVRRKSESEWQYNARILPRVMSRDSPRNYDTLDSDTHGSVSTVCQTNFTAKRSRASDNCNNNEINRVYKPKSNTCIEVGNRNLYGVTLENVHSAPQIQTKVDKNGNYCEPSSFPGFEVTEREETAQTCPTYIANYMRFQTLPASTPTNGNSSPEPHFVYESFPTPTDLVKVNRKKLKVKTNRDGVLIERRRTQSRSIFAGDQIGDPNGPAAKPQAERLVRNTAKPVLGERKQSWVTKPPRITCTPQIPPGSRRITRFQTTVDEEVVTAKTNRQNLSRLPKQPEATAKAWSRTTVGRETVTTKTTQRDLVTVSKQPETIHGDNGNIETAEQEFAGSEKQVHRKSSVEKLNGITDTPKTVTRSLYQGIRPTAEQHVDPKSSSAKMNGIPDPTMTISRSLDQRNRPGGEKGVEVRSSRTHLNGVPQVSRRASSAITVDHHQPLQQHTPLPQSREVSIKVVLLGDYGVGKSRLLQAFRKASSLGKTGIRCAEYRPKEFVELTMTEGERRLRVKIVDTAGRGGLFVRRLVVG